MYTWINLNLGHFLGQFKKHFHPYGQSKKYSFSLYAAYVHFRRSTYIFKNKIRYKRSYRRLIPYYFIIFSCIVLLIRFWFFIFSPFWKFGARKYVQGLREGQPIKGVGPPPPYVRISHFIIILFYDDLVENKKYSF